MRINRLSRTVFGFSLAVVASLSMSLSGEAKKPKSDLQSGKTKQASKAEKSSKTESTDLRERLSSMEASLSQGDSTKVAAFWSPDGSYTDADGNRTNGRTAIEKRFRDVFATSSRPLVEFVPQSCKFLSSDVAISEGIVQRKDGGNKNPETRYSIVFQKSNGEWLISSAVETPLDTTSDLQPPLTDLSWLIGEWSAERNGGTVQMKADWAANKNFISCIYQIKKTKDAPAIESRQVIGWDPRRDQPISWHFDANGGYGQSVWHRRGNKWVIESTGLEHDGSAIAATNIITLGEDKNFEWQSVDRSIDGVALNDAETLKIERVNQ